MKQFDDANCSRGAPLGRSSYGKAEDCQDRSIALFRVRFVDGDYDDGGAYWGGGIESGPLYCARFGDTYRAFIRARNRIEAASRLRVPEGKLLRGSV